MDQEPRQLDLEPLRARLCEKPRTKAGQVRHAWPEIRALLDAGHSLKDIHVWLGEIGIEIGYARLSDYTGKLRRRDHALANVVAVDGNRQTVPVAIGRTATSVAASSEQLSEPSESEDDPLGNIRDRERRQPGFQYNAEPDPKKLI